MARARTPFLGWRPAGRRAPAVLAGVAAAAVVLVLVAGVEGGRREGRGGLPDVLMGPNGYQSPVQYPVYQVNSQAHQRFSTLRTIAEARLGDTAGFQQLDEEEETPEEPAGGEEEETPEEPAGGASARSAPAKPAPPWRGRAPSGAFGFGFVGGVSWLVIILTIVFLFFILATVCAKKDSWVRALAYTFVSTPCPAAVPRCNRPPSAPHSWRAGHACMHAPPPYAAAVGGSRPVLMAIRACSPDVRPRTTHTLQTLQVLTGVYPYAPVVR